MKIITTLSLLAILAGSFAVTSCNTVEGAGEDIRAGGNAIDNAAERHKNY